MYLEANGIVGFHEAVSSQLLLVVNGQGWVRCDLNQVAHVSMGDAVFWEQGEWHETKTETGLTAIVIESGDLDPARFLSSRE